MDLLRDISSIHPHLCLKRNLLIPFFFQTQSDSTFCCIITFLSFNYLISFETKFVQMQLSLSKSIKFMLNYK